MSSPDQKRISSNTRLCAVFGHPIRHSASPAMHNAGFTALGLDWRYLAFDVDPVGLRQAIQGAAVMGFAGVNLTVPHKLLALEMVDKLDDSARRWGAVNTIRFEFEEAPGRWRCLGLGDPQPGAHRRTVGFNTDADALISSLDQDLGITSLEGKTAVLLGAGGAARAAALRLVDAGVRLHLINRTASKAIELARGIQAGHPAARVEVGLPIGPVDVLINATSAGLKRDDPLPLDPSALDWGKVGAVYDMIYQPAETKLLSLARGKGCKTSNGLGMLLHQGARAFEIWTEQKAPVSIMHGALQDHIYV